MKRPIALSGLLVCGALFCATPAAAQHDVPSADAVAPASTEARVRVLLAGIERVPTPEDWSAVGPVAVPVLVSIMNDTKEKVLTRGRAAIGLGHFATPESAEALRKVLTEPTTPALLVRKSIVALGRVDTTSVADIAPFLGHRSKRVREVAITALQGIGTEAARAPLTQRQAIETSPYLKELIAAALAKPVQSTPTANASEAPE